MSRLNWTLAAIQVLNLLVLVAWIVLIAVALVRLRRRKMNQTARALWTLIVVLIPVVGALALFVVEPGSRCLEEG